jgi:Na+-driven multidrug efflux pump
MTVASELSKVLTCGVIGFAIGVIFTAISYLLFNNKMHVPLNRDHFISYAATILPISFTLGLLYGLISGMGWFTIMMVITFVAALIVGFLLLDFATDQKRKPANFANQNYNKNDYNTRPQFSSESAFA